MEGGLGIKDFHGVKKYLHMKFSYKIHMSEGLWADFFKAKYLKGGHILSYNVKPSYSQFWKYIMACVPKVMANFQIILRGGNLIFWYDPLLGSGRLAVWHNDISQMSLKFKD